MVNWTRQNSKLMSYSGNDNDDDIFEICEIEERNQKLNISEKWKIKLKKKQRKKLIYKNKQHHSYHEKGNKTNKE